jgi:BCD family chlorophyll transporter-like MFS transporter
MFRLGLFQVGLGMMSVLVFGVLNRVLIRELGVPATIATIVLALTLFVAPARVWFGQLSDTKPLWGMHRTGYVLIGAACLTTLAFISVQVMWQVGNSLTSQGWTTATYAWMALLALVFALYGLAVSASSTPFATLLVDITDEENRSKIVGIHWSMLIGGTIAGAITIGVMLRSLELNASITQLEANLNQLFLVIPLLVFGLAWVATWNVERRYSRYALRSTLVNHESEITLGRAWRILNASRQTRLFFTFLICMTLGLFTQDPILENYGADVFGMSIGETAKLNAFWGTGTLIGISGAGFLLTPRIGKRNTAKWGCILTAISLLWVLLSGLTGNPKLLQIALLVFGLASGVTTTGAITLMLDLTAPETAGTFVGAWGLAQAFARGMATIFGGASLDLGKRLTANLVGAYGLVFTLQAIFMVVAIGLLSRVSVKEFQANAKAAIAAVIRNDFD